VGQEEAKRVVSRVICTHYRRLQYDQVQRLEPLQKEPKPNLMLIGDPGSGKTLILETAARIIGVPFAIQDASVLTESGYVGDDVNDVFRALLMKVDKNFALAEMGIVYFDEIDKLATPPGNYRDIGGKSVQQELLRVMEGASISLYTHGGNDQTINTRNMLFVMSGAFDGLQEIVRDRVDKKIIGFSVTIEEAPSLIPITQDLVKYGFDPQFLARVPNVVYLEKLTEEHLRQILHLPKYAGIAGRQRNFAAYGIDLNFTEDGLNALARKAAAYAHLGGRAVNRVLEETLTDFLYHLPSTEIREVEVNEALVNHPAETLSQMLKQYPVKTDLPNKIITETEKIRITYTPETYSHRLTEAGISPLLIDASVHYGLKYGCDPEEIPEIIQRWEVDIDDYQSGAESSWGIKLIFLPDARKEILREKLGIPSREISTILDRCTKHLTPDALQHLNTREVQINTEYLRNPQQLVIDLTRTRTE